MFVFFTPAPMCAALQAISKKLHLRPLCATANTQRSWSYCTGGSGEAEKSPLHAHFPGSPAVHGISNLFTTLHALALGGAQHRPPTGSKMHDEPRCLTYCKWNADKLDYQITLTLGVYVYNWVRVLYRESSRSTIMDHTKRHTSRRWFPHAYSIATFEHTMIQTSWLWYGSEKLSGFWKPKLAMRQWNIIAKHVFFLKQRVFFKFLRVSN